MAGGAWKRVFMGFRESAVAWIGGDMEGDWFWSGEGLRFALRCCIGYYRTDALRRSGEQAVGTKRKRWVDWDTWAVSPRIK